MSTRSLVLALVLTAPVPVAVAQTVPPEPPPRPTSALTAENAKLDLGRVMAGDTAVGTFVLHNHGDKVVTIVRAKPS